MEKTCGMIHVLVMKVSADFGVFCVEKRGETMGQQHQRSESGGGSWSFGKLRLS